MKEIDCKGNLHLNRQGHTGRDRLRAPNEARHHPSLVGKLFHLLATMQLTNSTPIGLPTGLRWPGKGIAPPVRAEFQHEQWVRPEP